MPFPDFQELGFEFEGEERTYFKAGAGPAIIVMHEVPGLYPEVADFGRRLVKAGYCVYMPSLLGTPGRKFTAPYAAQSLARACVMKEFTIWATGKNSPVTEWLKALARLAHAECGGPGVGAVGMCLTGGFALAMMADDCVVAPVLSQPSLPFALTGKRKRDLGINEETLSKVKSRAAGGVCLMALRFSSDWMAPKERFVRLQQELGDRFIAVEIDSSPGNAHAIPFYAHSVLVHDFVDTAEHPTRKAYEQVLSFFDDKLQPQP